GPGVPADGGSEHRPHRAGPRPLAPQPGQRRIPARRAGVGGTAALPTHARRRGTPPAPRRGRPVRVVVVAGALPGGGRPLTHRLPRRHAAPGAGRTARRGRPGVPRRTAVGPLPGGGRLRLAVSRAGVVTATRIMLGPLVRGPRLT